MATAPRSPTDPIAGLTQTALLRLHNEIVAGRVPAASLMSDATPFDTTGSLAADVAGAAAETAIDAAWTHHPEFDGWPVVLIALDSLPPRTAIVAQEVAIALEHELERLGFTGPGGQPLPPRTPVPVYTAGELSGSGPT